MAASKIAQKLKIFRKKAGLSQSELANKLGVPSQSISRWECGNGMPDLVQIVPLSKILKVSLDTLLDVSPDDDFENVSSSCSSMNAEEMLNIEKKKGVIGRRKDKYLTLMTLVKKYPFNYKYYLDCAEAGVDYLSELVLSNETVISEKNSAEIFNEIERMAYNVIAHDSDLTRKALANSVLFEINCIMGYGDKADFALEDFSGFDKMLSDNIKSVYESTDDSCPEKMDSGYSFCVRKMIKEVYRTSAVYTRALNLKGKNAIHVWRRFIELAEVFDKSVERLTVLSWVREGYIRLCREYLKKRDFDGFISAATEYTETCEAEFKWVKDYNAGRISSSGVMLTTMPYPPEPDDVIDLDEKKDTYLSGLVGCCDGRGGESISNSYAFRELVTRIKAFL